MLQNSPNNLWYYLLAVRMLYRVWHLVVYRAEAGTTGLRSIYDQVPHRPQSAKISYPRSQASQV